MGKVLNFLKKYSFGAYRTGLYANQAMVFGSVLSVFLSALFLLGLFVGFAIYFNEIFIQQQQHIVKQEIKSFKDHQLSSFSLPQALELYPNYELIIDLVEVGFVNETFCNKISSQFYCDNQYHQVNFTTTANQTCNLNLYQNSQIKEKCGDANQEKGFGYTGIEFYLLDLPLTIKGLDSTMSVNYLIKQKTVLSNGQLLEQRQGSYIDIFSGIVTFSSNFIQYNQTTSIFEQLISRLNTQYYQDAKSITVTSEKDESYGSLQIQQQIYPLFESYLYQPKQFYDIFPLIGALLGLLKFFSFVSIYNQNKFEKELEASLFPKEIKEEEGDTLQLTLNDDLGLNKSSEQLILQKTQPEIQDHETKLKFKELYSFATFKELYQNVLLLLKKTKSKEAHLNEHDQLLRNLQNDASQTTQKLNTVFEQLNMREEEITDLRTQKDQLQAKITTLEKQNSELRSKNANYDEQIQQIMSMMKHIQEQQTIKQASQKKND